MGLHISNHWSSHLMDITADVFISGLERSAKLSNQSISADRFLLAPQHKTFTADQLESILKGLNFPEKTFSEVMDWFGKSSQVALGFEQSKGVSSYRLYFEFFKGYRPNPSLNSGLLHLGYKWQCDDPSKMAITHYNYAPYFNGSNTADVIGNTLSNIDGHLLNEVISVTMKSIEDIPPQYRIITCAGEEQGSRRSFDVNLYKSNKKVNFIKTELESISRFFHIDQGVMNKFLADSEDAVLGHISSGLSSRNDHFFTVYFDDFSAVVKKVEA